MTIVDFLLILQSQDVPSVDKMLAFLVRCHMAVDCIGGGPLPSADSANAQSQVDLLTQLLTFHEMAAWMLPSALGACRT